MFGKTILLVGASLLILWLFIINQKFLATSVYPILPVLPFCSLAFGSEIPAPDGTYRPIIPVYYRDACYAKRIERYGDWKDCSRRFLNRNESNMLPDFTDQDMIARCAAELSKEQNYCVKLTSQAQQAVCTELRSRLYPAPTLIPEPCTTPIIDSQGNILKEGTCN